MIPSDIKFMSLAKLKQLRKNNLKKGSKICVSFPRHRPRKESKYYCIQNWPQIYDQGAIGSCTANAFCSVFKYLQDDKSFEPSRMYVYFKERMVESSDGTVSDSGAFVIDGCQYVAQNGVCSEKTWPYKVENVNIGPPSSCDEEAKSHKIGRVTSIRVDDKNLISTIGYFIVQDVPVMMAFGVYDSISETGPDGIIKMPHPESYNDHKDKSDRFAGGHEVVIIGFDAEKQLFKIANSWGETWGEKGYGYMPYAYVNNPHLVFDFMAMLNDF